MAIERQLQKYRREQFAKVTKHGLHQSKSFAFTLFHAANYRHHSKIVTLGREKGILVDNLEQIEEREPARELACEFADEKGRAEEEEEEDEVLAREASEFAEEHGRAEQDEEEEDLARDLAHMELQ